MSQIDFSSMWFDSKPAMSKDGKAYAIKPNSGLGDLTVERNCGFPATYVDSNGYIARYSKNNILSSDDFGSSNWSASTATITGTTEATVDASSSLSYLGQTLTEDGERRYYIEAKQGSSRYLTLSLSPTAGGSEYATFDLQTGVATTSKTSGVYGLEISESTEGFYRCSFAYNESTIAYRAYPINVDGVLSGAQGTITVRKPMISIGSGVYEYIASGGDSVIYDTPRYDYAYGGSCPSLLIETGSENLLQDSNNFNNSDWNLSNLTVDNYSSLSPENQNNASIVTLGSNSSEYILYSDLINFSTGDNYAFAVHFKRIGDLSKIKLKRLDASKVEIDSVTYDIRTKTVSDEVNASGRFALQVGGYERLVLNGSIPSAGNYRFAIYFVDSEGSEVWNGTGQTISIYEATLEERLEPSSLIPRSGTSVARLPEKLLITGSSLFNENAYMYLDVMFNKPRSSTNFVTLSISDTSLENRVLVYADSDMTSKVIVRGSGTNMLLDNVNAKSYFRLGQFDRVLIKYHSEDQFYAINGVVVNSNNDSSELRGATQFFTGSNNTASDSFYFDGRIRSIAFSKEEDITREKAIEYTDNNPTGSVVAQIGPSSMFYGGLEQGDKGSEPNIDNKAQWSFLYNHDNYDAYSYTINALLFREEIDLHLDNNSNPKDETDFNARRLTSSTEYQNLSIPKSTGLYSVNPDCVITSGGVITRFQMNSGYTGAEPLTGSQAEELIKDKLRKLLDYNINQGILTIIEGSFTIGENYTSGTFNVGELVSDGQRIYQWQQEVVAEYSENSSLVSLIDVMSVLDLDDNGKMDTQFLQSDNQHWNEDGYAAVAGLIKTELENKLPNAVKTVSYYA
jgi:hypothetical protein